MDGILFLTRKLWLLLRRKRFYHDLAEELSFHREQLQRELQADGMAPGSGLRGGAPNRQPQPAARRSSGYDWVSL